MIPVPVSGDSAVAKLGQRDLTKENFWRQKIAELHRSGLTKSEFCRREGLRRNSLSNWEGVIHRRDRETANAKRNENRQRQKQQRQLPSKSEFVEMRVRGLEEQQVRACDVIEIACPNSVTLKVPATLPLNTLLAILNMLRR